MTSGLARFRPSPAMVVACTALLVALGGTGYAALKLPRNSVGPKQLRNGAVTTKKLAKGAVTGAKVKPDSLGGAQVDESTLGVVPNAAHASSADSATSATNATNATNATTAQNVAAPEAFHLVGAPGGPAFQNSWTNNASIYGFPAGFYKDRGGVVHLRGRISGGASNTVIFQLPAGYRPASGKSAFFAVVCECVGTQTAPVSVTGSGLGAGAVGGVRLENSTLSSGGSLWLDGISFRAES